MSIIIKYIFILILIQVNVKTILSTQINSNVADLRHSDALNSTTICTVESSIDDFPNDMFSENQRKNGAVILHFIGALYFFTLLAVVCNDYFLPSVECICNGLNISKDVAAATFMATATTTPELFTNIISTFIAESDMGLGTIIGSLTFNTLGVAAIAGLAATIPVQLDWWPITRDCFLYTINLIVLIIFSWDNRITLTESIIMIILYFTYFIILFQNKFIMPFIRDIIENKLNLCNKNSHSYDMESISSSKIYLHNNDNINNIEGSYKQINQIFIISSISKMDLNSKSNVLNNHNDTTKNYNDDQSENVADCNEIDDSKVNRKSLWRASRDSRLKTIWWFYTWPIKFLLTFTIPNPKTWPKLYPITFFICIIFIGFNSYMIVWMITVMGDTFSVPESVMGLTFLAAGGCMPEAISSVIMIRKGEGGIGVSNSLGANSLAILLSLGLPWLIRNIINHNNPEKIAIVLQSHNIIFTILTLLAATALLYIVISISRYQLKRTVGTILLCVYLLFMTIGILLEMDIIYPRHDC